MRSLVEMLSGRPTVSLVIHRSQLLWRVSSLDSWVLGCLGGEEGGWLEERGEGGEGRRGT